MRMLIQFNAVHRTVADNAQEKRCNKKRFVCIKKVDELESTILWIQFLCATFTLSLQKLVMPVAETYGQWILCRALIFNSLRIIPALVIRTPSSIYCKCNFLSVLENNLLFSVSRCHHIYIHSIPYRSVLLLFKWLKFGFIRCDSVRTTKWTLVWKMCAFVYTCRWI